MIKTKVVKSKSELKKALDRIFKKKIRLRDVDDTGWAKCISCGKWVQYKTPGCHAGHYIPAGVSSPLRWVDENVNVQCNTCNTFKHGDIHEYRNGMIDKYGEDKEREIWERRHERDFYPSREWLEMRIKEEKEEVKLLEEAKGLK